MTGARTSLYLSTELLASARLLDINISEICRRALEAEIAARLDKLEHAVAFGRDAEMMLEQIRTGTLASEGSDPID